MKSFSKFCFLSGLLVVTLGFLSANAQVDYSTATLRGTVMDPQGAVVSGATVTATNPATGLAKTAKTGGDGAYRIPALPPGTYTVTFEAAGFSKEIAKTVELTVGQIQAYDVHLKVGSASETVEVSSDSVPLIQTEQTQQANTINSLQVDELPNINHDITQQVYTLPGVANANSPRTQNPGFTGFGTTGFSIGGSNGRNNLSTIDGGENEYGTGQYRITTIPQDVIQEYQVNRNGFAAEFGFTDGSAINIVTKAGGNKYHGSVYGEFQNHSTSATNFFNGIEGLPAAYNQNVYTGFTVGGPVKTDKLFFFLAYEYRRLDNPDFNNAGILNASTVTTGPSPAEVAYVSALAIPAPLKAFVIGSLTPLNNPALKQILTSQNGIFINPFRYHNSVLRFDGQPNQANSLGLRVIYSHDDSVQGNKDNSSLLTRDFSVLGTWTHNFGASQVNQVLVQIVPKNVANNFPLAPFQGTNFSLGNLNSSNLGGTSSFGSPALTPYLAHQKRYQFEDNFTFNHGPHTFKVGASMRLADYHVEDDLWFNNEFDFKDNAVPLFFAIDILCAGGCGAPPAPFFLSAPQAFNLGMPADVLAGNLPTSGGPSNPKWSGWGKYFGSYVQDTWKINSRFTVNAGVRFDDDGEPSPLSSSFYASPRLGFAWDPFGDQKTVIRAGGGIYVAPIDVLIPSYGSLLDGSGRYINEVLSILSATNFGPPVLWLTGLKKGELPFGTVTPADYTAAGIPFLTPGALVAYGVAPGYKNPYTVQASLGIDRQLGKSYAVSLGYNMYHGVHLQMPFDTALSQISPGNPLCAASPLGAAACADFTGGPLYTFNSKQLQHTTYESIGSSIYHSMTASLTKRYSNNLQFQVNYTWSKSIDNVIDFASFQNWFRPADLAAFRAVSVFDIPHTIVGNAVYTTPFKAGTGNVLNSILADISLAPIVTWRSGLPFSIRTPSLQNVAIPGAAGPTLTTGLDQNYAMPFGATRDANRGPAYTTTDLSIRKAFFISRDRGVKLEASATGTNIFNRVNFNRVSDEFDINGIGPTQANPGLCATCVQTADGVVNLKTGPFTGLHGIKPTSASQITTPLSFSGADLPRLIQFGLKLAF